MATWSDFTLVGSTTGTGAGSLTVAGVQANDLIIACSAALTPYTYYAPSVPTHNATGVETRQLFSKNSIPQTAQWYYHPHYYWRYRYYPYYGNYWWFWNYNWWYYRYPVVASTITVYRADSAGDVTVNFGDPSAQGSLYSTYLRVWKPNISVGGTEALRSIGIAESAQGASSVGVTATMPVVQDELLMAIGIDTTAAVAGDMTVAGPSVQELVDFNPVYANRTSRIKLWRVKTTTTATVTYARCNAGRSLMKFSPNVEVVQTAQPVANEAVIYVEIQPELNSSGRVTRPRWFDAIRTTYAYSYSTGLRKRWMKEAATISDTGEAPRARLVELWKFPEDARTSVPTNEAITYTDFATAEARVVHHDLGW